jgi:hypothetical protein
VLIIETLWKNNLNFAKDVPTVYVNFITIIIRAEKKTGHYICTASRSTVKLRSQLYEKETFYCVVCDNLTLSILHCMMITFSKAETCCSII